MPALFAPPMETTSGTAVPEVRLTGSWALIRGRPITDSTGTTPPTEVTGWPPMVTATLSHGRDYTAADKLPLGGRR